MPWKEKPIEYYVDENGCHICTSHSRYKVVNGKTMQLHTYVYKTKVRNEIPKGMVVVRKCGNKKCINPEHMTLLTKAEDAAQKAKKYNSRPLKYEIDPVTGCHICTSHQTKKFNGKTVDIHTYFYLTRVSPEIPEGKVVAHTCLNRRCINTKHLYLATPAEVAIRVVKEYLARPIEYEVDHVTGCHNCTSHSAGHEFGYHKVSIDSVQEYIHRVVYEREYGPIPEGLVVRHKCDNPHCINPAHLEIGTQGDNRRDAVERGRQPRGSKHTNAKLTEEDVREIKKRLAAGEMGKDLAQEYGVCKQLISDIKLGKRWTHVTID